jgi:hypothetical protein
MPRKMKVLAHSKERINKKNKELKRAKKIEKAKGR